MMDQEEASNLGFLAADEDAEADEDDEAMVKDRTLNFLQWLSDIVTNTL